MRAAKTRASAGQVTSWKGRVTPDEMSIAGSQEEHHRPQRWGREVLGMEQDVRKAIAIELPGQGCVVAIWEGPVNGRLKRTVAVPRAGGHRFAVADHQVRLASRSKSMACRDWSSGPISITIGNDPSPAPRSARVELAGATPQDQPDTLRGADKQVLVAIAIVVGYERRFREGKVPDFRTKSECICDLRACPESRVPSATTRTRIQRLCRMVTVE
jgi:hypothetical protein